MLGATYNVDSTADQTGTCSPAPAVCPSLRQAIDAINASPSPPDVINVPAGDYVLSNGTLNITENMTLNGAGAGTGASATTVDGNGDQVFNISGSNPSSVTLDGMNVQGTTSVDAAAIDFEPSNTATLTLSNDAIINNQTEDFESGAIYFDDNGNSGALAIADSTIAGNTITCCENGAGIAFENGGMGTLTIDGSTLSGNGAASNSSNTGLGGGVYFDGATATITNSTISGNTASQGAGLYLESGTTTLLNDTIADNILSPSGGSGAGIFGAATVTADNTIVSGNSGATASTNDCDAPVASSDHSLEDGTGCGFDLPSSDPMLEPLGDNGGPTDTMALAAGSAAIDAGDKAHCPAIDQRGFSRPDVSGSACDVGAYESGGPPMASITAPANGSAVALGQVVQASYACAPGVDGTLKLGSAGCSGPVPDNAAIDTATPGVHTFTVAATDTDGQMDATTSRYTVVSPPRNTGQPVISGNPKAGGPLSCSTGSWANDPTSFGYQWYRDGTPLAGATTPERVVQTLDEGTTLTCAVTAVNVAGMATSESKGVNVPVPVVPRCPGATGRASGVTLGLIKLGMTRARAHYLYRRHSDRGKQYEDFFCLTPIGVRVGYGSPKLLKILSKSERKQLLDRVVWSSTSNPFYSIDGVRPGESIAVASADLHTEPPFHIGLNYWYLARKTTSTAVLKVRDGVVEEIGIGDNVLTDGRKAQRIFMNSFY